MGSYSTTSTHPLIYKMKSSVFAIGLLLLATANASPPFLKAEDTCETLKCCEKTTTTGTPTTTSKAPTPTTGAPTSTPKAPTTTTTVAPTTTSATEKPTPTNMKAETPTTTVTTTTVAPTCETLNCECNGAGQIFSCVGILLVAFL